MGLAFRTSAHSEVGLVRKNNQDSAYTSPNLLIVADGMGGAAAGDLASAVAIAALAEMDADLPARLAAASENDENADDALRGILGATLTDANERIAALVAHDPSLEGMGTTVSGFARHGDGVEVVNIGDSRAYLVRDGELRRVTRDHSWVQTLVDEGRITEEEALEHPHRSLILRVLNGNPTHEPEFDWLDLRAGDRLLVCSDGLCGLVPDASIAARVIEPDREVALASLVNLAHDAGGYDNITIVLADLVEGEPEPGVALLGSARTTTIPSPEDAAAPTAPTASQRRLSAEDQRYALAPRSGRRGARLALGVLLPLLLVMAGGFGWYQFSQAQYYLGANTPATGNAGDATVAVFQGMPDRVLGYPLSHVAQTSDVRLADLPPLYAKRVLDVLKVASLEDGKNRLVAYKGYAERCVAQRAARAAATVAPSPSPTPTPPSVTTPAGTTPATAPTPGVPTTTAAPQPGTGPASASLITPPTTASPSATTSPAQPPTPEDC